MKEPVNFIRTFVLVLLLGGCSTFTVKSVETPKTDDTFSKTRIALFWGISDIDAKAECEGRGLEFVSMQTNYLYELCSVVTLGIVVPMEVTYRCAGRPIIIGDTL